MSRVAKDKFLEILPVFSLSGMAISSHMHNHLNLHHTALLNVAWLIGNFTKNFTNTLQKTYK